MTLVIDFNDPPAPHWLSEQPSQKKSFDESQHPRDHMGRFSETTDGDEPGKPSARTIAGNRILARMALAIDDARSWGSGPENEHGQITDEKKAQYLATASKAISPMNEKALTVLQSRIRKFMMFDSTAKLTAGVAPEVYQQSHGMGVIGGAYNTANGTINLDGDFDKEVLAMPSEGSTGAAADALGTYAHEFSHALDWYEGRADGLLTKEEIAEYGLRPSTHLSDMVSATPIWTKAALKEIILPENQVHEFDGIHINMDGKVPISKYAMSSAPESWAEFGRLVWTERARAKRDFPECYGIWKRLGYVE